MLDYVGLLEQGRVSVETVMRDCLAQFPAAAQTDESWLSILVSFCRELVAAGNEMALILPT